MSETVKDAATELAAFVDVLKELREKCPWDKVQTIHTLRRFTIEELYELLDAIDEENMVNVCEELGDIMTHVVFYANIAEEQKDFTLAEVLHKTRRKLINRHPHIYGDGSLKLQNDREVERNWEKLKEREHRSMFSGLPKSLPSIIKAQKLQDKVSRAGFDWDNAQQALENIERESEELQQSIREGKQGKVIEEFGDLFFSLISYGRHLGIDPDAALEQTNRKFQNRIKWIEETLHEKEAKMRDKTKKELAALWAKSKEQPEKRS